MSRARPLHLGIALSVALGALPAVAGGDGAPSFECRRIDPKGDVPFGVITADWNGDGRLDLAVSNAGSGTISILLGTGSGRFARAPALLVGANPRSMDAADIDGDGDLDFAVGHARGGDVFVFRGDGKGGFEFVDEYSSGEHPFDVAFVDLDEDGKLDLLVVNESNSGYSSERGKIGIHTGKGDGTFERRPALLYARRFPAGLAVGELNGKPGVDFGVSNWGTDEITLFFNEGGGVFSDRDLPKRGINPYDLAAADFDGDGHTDLAHPDLRGGVHLRWGVGDGTFPTSVAFETGRGVRWVEAADVNDDGLVDLLTADVFDDQISILRNAGDRKFWPAQSIPVGAHPRMVKAGDLDGDGRTDLVVTNEADNDLVLLFQRDAEGARPCPPKKAAQASAPDR